MEWPNALHYDKKNNKKNIINKFYVDFKNIFFKDQKNDTHLLS